MTRSPLPFAERWINVTQNRRRDRVSDYVCDFFYLVSGFHL